MGGKRGQAPFAGTARRVLRTNGACPLFPSPRLSRQRHGGGVQGVPGLRVRRADRGQRGVGPQRLNGRPGWRSARLRPLLLRNKAPSRRGKSDSGVSASVADATPTLIVKGRDSATFCGSRWASTGADQIGLGHDHDELVAAVTHTTSTVRHRGHQQVRQLAQRLVAVEVAPLIVRRLKLSRSAMAREKGVPYRLKRSIAGATMPSSAQAVADAGEGIDLMLGKPLQVGAMVADALLGAGNLADELQRRAQDALDFAAQLVPGRVLGPGGIFPSAAIRPRRIFAAHNAPPCSGEWRPPRLPSRQWRCGLARSRLIARALFP